MSDIRIAKLSALLNSALRIQSSNDANKQEAYLLTMKVIEELMPPKQLNQSEKDKKSPIILQLDEARPECIVQSPEEPSKDKTPEPQKRENTEKIGKAVKKRMKWNEYLEKQVGKEQKMHGEIGANLKRKLKASPPKSSTNKIPTKANLRKLEYNLRRFKPVKPLKNFKKFDEQEGFCEPPESPEESKETIVPEGTTFETKPDQALPEPCKTSIDDDQRVKEVLERYRKTFGKLQIAEPCEGTPLIPIPTKIPSQPKRSKSSHSNYSTERQREIIFKLKILSEEEEKIKIKKEELLKFLEDRSQVKEASRPVTVSSLYTRNNATTIPVNRNSIRSALPCIPKIQQPGIVRNHSSNLTHRKSRKNEVNDLINSIF